SAVRPRLQRSRSPHCQRLDELVRRQPTELIELDAVEAASECSNRSGGSDVDAQRCVTATCEPPDPSCAGGSEWRVGCADRMSPSAARDSPLSWRHGNACLRGWLQRTFDCRWFHPLICTPSFLNNASASFCSAFIPSAALVCPDAIAVNAMITRSPRGGNCGTVRYVM